MPRSRQLAWIAVSAVGAEQVEDPWARLGDGLEFSLLPAEAGQIEFVAEFAAQHLLAQHIRIVEDRQNDGNLRLIVHSEKP